jgi:hypothetical protein
MAIYVDFKKDPILTGEEVCLSLFILFVNTKEFHITHKHRRKCNKTKPIEMKKTSKSISQQEHETIIENAMRR